MEIWKRIKDSSLYKLISLRQQRRIATLEKQIELIKETKDESLIQTFITEDIPKKPIPKIKILIVGTIIVGMALLAGFNIEMVLKLIGPFLL